MYLLATGIFVICGFHHTYASHRWFLSVFMKSLGIINLCIRSLGQSIRRQIEQVLGKNGAWNQRKPVGLAALVLYVQ